jgi:hypothetical protein
MKIRVRIPAAAPYAAALVRKNLQFINLPDNTFPVTKVSLKTSLAMDGWHPMQGAIGWVRFPPRVVVGLTGANVAL